MIEEIEKVLSFFEQKTDRQRTKEAYRSAVNRFTDFLVENKKTTIAPIEFTQYDALAYQDWWINRGNAKKTINSMIGHIKAFFEHWKSRGVIPANPFEKIKPFKLHQSTAHAVFALQTKTLIWDFMKKNYIRLYYFTKIIYYTFLRPKEILSLKVSDFDLKNKVIRVDGTISKNRNTEFVVITKQLQEVLIEMELDQLNPNLILFSKKLLPGEVIWSRNRVSELHRFVLDLLEIPKKHDLYSWKHTGAVEAYRKGSLGVKEIQAQMRHSSSHQTDKYLRGLGVITNETIRDAEW